MTKRLGSFRRGTRNKLRKKIRTKGKISFTRFLQQFKADEQVILLAEPAIQSGMYYPRFHGLVGKIQNKIGSCYKIKINDGKKQKLLIIHPVHLRKVKNAKH